MNVTMNKCRNWEGVKKLTFKPRKIIIRINFFSAYWAKTLNSVPDSGHAVVSIGKKFGGF